MMNKAGLTVACFCNSFFIVVFESFGERRVVCICCDVALVLLLFLLLEQVVIGLHLSLLQLSKGTTCKVGEVEIDCLFTFSWSIGRSHELENCYCTCSSAMLRRVFDFHALPLGHS